MSADAKLIRKIANRIDNDNGYDNLLMAKDIVKIAREYHAKEMERKLKKTPFRDFYTLAEWLHNNYEEIALNNGWKTQSDCQVPFDELPNENKEVMLELALRLLTHLKEQKQDKG